MPQLTSNSSSAALSDAILEFCSSVLPCIPAVDTSSLVFSLAFIVVGFAIGYWWKNTGQGLWLIFITCGIAIIWAIHDHSGSTSAAQITENGVPMHYPPYPSIPFFSCPNKDSTCLPPHIFEGIAYEINQLDTERRNFIWEIQYQRNPMWSTVIDDLRKEGKAIAQVQDTLSLAIKGSKERDRSVLRLMHDTQTKLAQLAWTKQVPLELSYKYPKLQKTKSDMMCEFLTDVGKAQELYLQNPDIVGLNMNMLYLKQRADITRYHTRDVHELAKPNILGSLFSGNPEALKVSESMYDRYKSQSEHQQAISRTYQEYIKMETEVLHMVQNWQDEACLYRPRVHAGDFTFARKTFKVNIGNSKLQDAEMTWYIGRQIRKAASHVFARVRKD